MVGGDFAIFSSVLPVFELFWFTDTHMGSVGSGQASRTANQAIIGGSAGVVCDEQTFSEKLNLF
jgi:3-hydroxyisobutyrate dehydrogenase-like beta-hydroxyacid dehydrogenase